MCGAAFGRPTMHPRPSRVGKGLASCRQALAYQVEGRDQTEVQYSPMIRVEPVAHFVQVSEIRERHGHDDYSVEFAEQACPGYREPPPDWIVLEV